MKMTYEGAACEITVSENFRFFSQVSCSLEFDSVRYATCRFFQKSKALCRECVFESWQLRISKSRKRKTRHFYVIPAVLMELPGNWAKVTITIDTYGVCVQQLELLQQHPFLKNKTI